MTAQGRRARQEVLPILLHGDAAFAGQGVVAEMPRLLRPARLRHRRHDPLHHQQPGRLHHQPAVRALVALSVGRRQGHPGADPARQRRRSGSGDLLLQAGDRVPPARSAATSSSTCGATAASATTRATSRASPSRSCMPRSASTRRSAALRRAADREGVVDQAWIDKHTKDLSTISSRSSRPRSYLPNKADWFEGRWAGLGRPDEPVLGRRNTATAIDDDRLRALGEIADHGPRRSSRPQDAAAHPRRQEGDVRQRRRVRLGDGGGAGVRQPGLRRLRRPPVGPGQRPRHLQPAPRGVGRPGNRRQSISR
jgi:hypothetical protein